MQRTLTFYKGRRHRRRLGAVAGLVGIAIIAAACGDLTGETEPLEPAEAQSRVAELADDIDWQDQPITRKASVTPGTSKVLADTLPDISQFPLVVDAQPRADQTVAEIFVSTEKSGTGTDGWMTEAADSFNRSNIKLADGTDAKVAIRKIASGTGYQFVAAGDQIPAGFSPSNHLWVSMADTHSPMSVLTDQTVTNVAGIVMKDETAEELRER